MSVLGLDIASSIDSISLPRNNIPWHPTVLLLGFLILQKPPKQTSSRANCKTHLQVIPLLLACNEAPDVNYTQMHVVLKIDL